VEFHSGDMLAAALGRFDYVVGMDSMIHYQREDVIRALGELAQRTEQAMLFTFAPGNPLLSTMLAVGRLFPRGDRAPFIEPVAEATLRRLIGNSPALAGWTAARTQRIRSGFYQSQALELQRA
jgi:magnesium-protoporphyrin O-methyltransferase